MPSFSLSGWDTTSASPKSLESRKVSTAPVVPVNDSSIGVVNATAQTPLTAGQLQTASTSIKDPSLASRVPSSADLAGRRQAAIQTSVYQTPASNIPSFLSQSISDLNLNQSLRRAAHSELIDRLFQEAMTGNLAAWDALRAASVQPGAHVQLAPLTDPNVGIGFANQAQAAAAQLAAQTSAVRAAQAVPSQIAALEAQQSRLGSAPFGTYVGSPQQRIDQQLMDLYSQRSGRSATQQLGQSAARGGSAWVPQPPRIF